MEEESPKPQPQDHHQQPMSSPPRSPPSDPEAPAPPLALPAPPDKPPSPVSAPVIDALLAVSNKQPDQSKVVQRIVDRDRAAKAMNAAAPAARAAAAVLSLIAFSLMASDKTQGWAGDSFDRYREYNYLVAVNVIVFVYSGFQLYAHLHLITTRSHIIRRPFSFYFDFALDQVLAYLMMSASSSAATRNSDWVSTFGSDGFTKRASGSIAVSFLAFFAVAFSSLSSAHNLFGRL